jgi:hypothetical protein
MECQFEIVKNYSLSSVRTFQLFGMAFVASFLLVLLAKLFLDS